MKRCFRLTRSSDFKRVRRYGKSYAHPLMVLYDFRSGHPRTRVGVTAGVAVGNAVRRNRAKRLLRAAMNTLLPMIAPGSDLMLVARSPLAESNLEETLFALLGLLKRASLLASDHDN